MGRWADGEMGRWGDGEMGRGSGEGFGVLVPGVGKVEKGAIFWVPDDV
jgi:hypothetical protein